MRRPVGLASALRASEEYFKSVEMNSELGPTGLGPVRPAPAERSRQAAGVSDINSLREECITNRGFGSENGLPKADKLFDQNQVLMWQPAP